MTLISNALIIFVKNPELGRCKTRLAATLGEKKALDVYINLLSHTRKVASELNAARYLFYDKEINKLDEWAASLFYKKLQANGDLGDRMQNAFDVVLNAHEKVIIIGSDCPELTSSILNMAFEALDKNDVVIGPTHDGGYYLLGMKTPTQFLFNNMEWSTENVFETTISRLKNKNKSFHVLETLSDLDNEDDLKRFPHFNKDID